MRFSSRLAGWNLAVGFCGRKICLTDIQGVEPQGQGIAGEKGRSMVLLEKERNRDGKKRRRK